MSNIKKELKNYYSETRKMLECSKRLKTKFINDLLDNIEMYIQENPDATMNDIKIKFGTPGELAESFFYPMDGKDKNEYRNRYKILRKVGIVSIIAILIAIIGLYIFNYIYVKNSTATINYDIIIENGE